MLLFVCFFFSFYFVEYNNFVHLSHQKFNHPHFRCYTFEGKRAVYLYVYIFYRKRNGLDMVKVSIFGRLFKFHSHLFQTNCSMFNASFVCCFLFFFFLLHFTISFLSLSFSFVVSQKPNKCTRRRN